MTYFKNTTPDNWVFEDAVKSKLQQNTFCSYEQVFQSLRSDLDFHNDAVAIEWKQNWELSGRHLQ